MSASRSKTTLTLLLLLSVIPTSSATDPQPILATTGSDFLGYDGLWSPISIRVGSPEQWLSVLPSTLSQETWIIGPGGCDGSSTCQSVRGGIFYSNESTTFQDYGFYELGSDAGLDGSQLGFYGLDTLALDDNVSEQDQIIAIINTTDSLLGQLGLGVQQTRLNGSENELPFLSSLVQNHSAIPSHSYGYTAGAAYRLTGVPASLALGGIDANRFEPNDMSFTLRSDYAPVLAINSISVSSSIDALPPNWNSNPTQLSDGAQAEIYTIDTSTPFLWLPEAICENFASTLNLTYNDTLQLYLFAEHSSAPQILKEWDLTFNFSLGRLPGAEDNIELSLPYDAFNLQLSYPFPNLGADFSSPPINYFPLRKSANDGEFIIGRAFLQETYLTVDYERNSFSISQAVFTEEAVNNVALYAITRPDDSIFPGPQSPNSGLSVGAMAGIGAAAGLIAVLAAVLIWFYCVRRKRVLTSEAMSEKPKRWSLFSRWTRSSGSNTTVSELVGDKRHPTEVPADATTSRFELAGSAPLEMPAAEVSPTFLQDREGHAGAVLRNDPDRPAELEHSRSATKEAEATAAAAGSDRSSSPVPPYSPSDLRPRFSSSVSPYSVRNSRTFGTVSSGEQGISPVGNTSGNLSNSQRASGNLPSPVSPEATIPRFHRNSDNGTNNSVSPHSSTGPFLNPSALGRAPSRSPSRSSRFVEEGLSTASTSERAETPQPSTSHESRFSWEQ